MPRPFLSVVVPAFNEESHIRSCIERLCQALEPLPIAWEIVVSDDGSHDRTCEIARACAEHDPRVRLLTGPHQGKGAAVRRGLLDATGEWRFMADADLSMPPENIQRFLTVIADDPGVSLIIGSREAPGAERVGEPRLRWLIGRLFNWVVRLIALPGLKDTQCGFKLISATAVERLCRQTRVDGFSFDVELLVLARRAGLRIREVGVIWHCRLDSRVTLRRGGAAFGEILAVRWRAARGAYGPMLRDAGPDAERIGPLTARVWAYVVAAILAATIGYDLWRMPIQVGDALGEILDAQRSNSISDAFLAGLGSAGYMRPLRIAQIKALFDLSHGYYWLAYRGFHVALIALCFLLFVRALRIRTRTDLAAAAFALTVLIGASTFRGTVQEAFPINHFLEIVVCCLLAVNLAQSRGGLLVHVTALVTFVAGALTLESGLLVLVVIVSGWAAGQRGITLPGVLLLFLCLTGYFYLRFAYLNTGVPSLAERSAGYLFEVLDPSDLQARFGAHPFHFYFYNVVASVFAVLFAEPQSGVLIATRAFLADALEPRHVLSVVGSTTTTALIGWTAWRYVRRHPLAEGHGHLLLMFVGVLVGNAVLSFAYTKDEIMSPAGVFYALASYVAVRHLVMSGSALPRTAAVLAVACLLLGATTWSVRSVGIHNVLKWQAFRHRNDWARLPGMWKREQRWPTDPAQLALVTQLRNQAIGAEVNSQPVTPWADRVWGD